VVALLLYTPMGVGGVVLGTVIATVAMALAQAWFLRPDLGGVEGRRTVAAIARMLVAAGLLAGVSYVTWWALDRAIGAALWAQVVSVGTAILTGTASYALAVWLLRIEEARQISRLVGSRLRRS
jgi:putative peptidoglycan lipid II flippase